MLLRFGGRNHRSVRDRQELSLVASSLRDEDAGLIDFEPAGVRLLPVVLIYGANASGKSNVIDALQWMRAAVLYSHSRGRPDGGVPRQSFVLDQASSQATTAVDIDFVIGDVRYHYGFEASDAEFVAEWLYALPNNRRQLLFDRRRSSFSFGRHLSGRNRVVADLTRRNSLYLSTAMQNKHEQLTSIGSFFNDIYIQGGDRAHPVRIAEELAGGTPDRRVIDFLAKAGTGVSDFRVSEIPLTGAVTEFRDEFAKLLRKLDPNAEAPDISGSRWRIELGHPDGQGAPHFLDLSEESDGTRRLLLLLPAILRDIARGDTTVIDELNASLHTQACEALLALFSTRATNPRGAQLIATTHDTNLLHSKLLRRDQIWFTEKDEGGATHVYPLTDIRTRRQDNLARGYLQGRYGAIPFAGPVADLLAAG